MDKNNKPSPLTVKSKKSLAKQSLENQEIIKHNLAASLKGLQAIVDGINVQNKNILIIDGKSKLILEQNKELNLKMDAILNKKIITGA